METMLLKLIRCAVPPAGREAFSAAQKVWAGLSGTRGFAGQCGGWSTAHPDRAVVLALWRSKADYDAFMRDVHDRFFLSSGQAKTYEAIEVALFDVVQDFAAGKSFFDGLAVRMADCTVLAGRQGHFEDMQREVWIPGMRQCPGFQNGYFALAHDASRRYLVATAWESLAAHQAYQDSHFGPLRDRAEPDLDLAGIEGDLVVLAEIGL